MSVLHTPAEGAVLNPFVMVDNAAGLVAFVSSLFEVAETPEAHTEMPDGKLIHSEVRLGTVNLMIVDRQDGWPSRPAFLQVWVNDVSATLKRASDHGATVVTEATPFYGETTLGRMLDPWQNLWWLYAPAPGQPDPIPNWDDEGSDTIFTTLDATLRSLR
ncbi:glyoxalase [Actinoplanes sp. Pm04-4]|uniref:Glyoxalase n=1 Tax=Paractinoplanes pyxinae TaxID=2997416 RepID=A0ABT4B3K8_9ACTN|nr:VOC family protein [Actinoplanes pyxinae]MCY1141065.1 glyoxalase [Actinoplanes pyxinae]